MLDSFETGERKTDGLLAPAGRSADINWCERHPKLATKLSVRELNKLVHTRSFSGTEPFWANSCTGTYFWWRTQTKLSAASGRSDIHAMHEGAISGEMRTRHYLDINKLN